MDAIFYDDLDAERLSLSSYALQEFKFRFTDWQQVGVIYRINWVANCVKHRDGFPTKEPIPPYFAYDNANEKIKITKDLFKNDAELLIKYTNIYLQLAVFIASYRFLLESRTRSGQILSLELDEKVNDVIDQFQQIVVNMIEALRD